MNKKTVLVSIVIGIIVGIGLAFLGSYMVVLYKKAKSWDGYVNYVKEYQKQQSSSSTTSLK